MWEYKRIEYKFKNVNELDTQLNKEGDDGWEIIYYHETKPARFGEEYTSIVLYKKIRQLPSG